MRRHYVKRQAIWGRKAKPLLENLTPGYLCEPDPSKVYRRNTTFSRKATRVAGFESNYGLIKRFEPYLKDMDSTEDFFNTIEDIINTQLPEFKAYKQEVKEYLALYFNMDMN